MKSRKLLMLILVLTVLLTSLTVLTSCGEKKLEDIVFEDDVFTYDGLEHSIEVDGLPSKATVTYSPTNTYTDIGDYHITATVEYKNKTVEFEAVLSIVAPNGYSVPGNYDAILAKLNEALAAAELKNDEKIEALKTEYQAKIDAITSQYDADITELEYALQDKLNAQKAAYDAEISAITALIDDLLAFKSDTMSELVAAKDRIAELETRIAELLVVTRHAVSFNLAGGNESIPEQNVVHGYKATKPADPTREGYDFVGWYLGDEEWSFIGYSVTEDITLSAKWVRKTYTVTIDGYTYDDQYIPIIVYHGDTVTLPDEDDLEYSGVFEGWYLNGNEWDETTPITEDINLTPRFASYVSYNLNGGESHSNPTVIRNDDTYPIILSAPTKDNNTFVGWYTNPSFYGSPVESINYYSSSYTLYARWEFNNEGGYPWDQTTITFSINEDSDTDQLPSTSKRYLAGVLEESELRDHSRVDDYVEDRNTDATNYTGVSVQYQYLPDGGNYGWGQNIQYIYRQATGGATDAPDVYVNFVYDMVAASLKGAFANLYSTTMYGADHEWSSSEYNYFAFEDNRAYRDTGKDYMYEYMRSLTLSKHKMYCLSSDYFVDMVRAFFVVPVNIAMLETIPMSSNEGEANSDRNYDGKFDIQDFYELVWADEWNYETLAYFANVVTRMDGDDDDTIDLDDTIGFALGTGSGLPASGMLYSTSITIVERSFNGIDYEYSYPNIIQEANGTFVFDDEYEDATFEQLDTFTQNLATLVNNYGVITVSTDEAKTEGYRNEPDAIRKKFANNTLLFGGVIVLGGLEHQDYLDMKGEGRKGYGIVPIPYYHTDLADGESYSTQIHNNGKIGAISIGTKKFAQCTAYLNYQSTNSNKVLNEYYKQKLRQTTQLSGTDQNSEMLNYIRSHVRSSFDKAFEDALGAHYSAQSAGESEKNKWHTMIKDANFNVTDMRAQYAAKATVKATNLYDLATRVYLTLPA